MRPKVVIPILLFSVAALLTIFLARPDRRKSSAALPLPETTPMAVTAGDAETASSIVSNHRATQAATLQTDIAFDQQTHEDYVSQRVAELMYLAMTDDTSSLYSILSELNNNDPQIREAAVTASVQFKNLEAIPALQDAYTRSDDPEEKIRIAKAIDFLATPLESQATGLTN
jgi:HEAT repeat protein